jgi:hypothetical protein
MQALYEIEQKIDKNGKPRGYMLDGKRVLSVTKALSILDKPALKGWAWRIAMKGSAAIPPMQRTEEEQEKALIAAGHGWWQVRNEAALRGHSLHAALSSLIEDGKPPELDDFPEEQHGYVQALAKYWIERQPKLLFTELPVGSRKHHFGGRIDLVRLGGPRPADPRGLQERQGGHLRRPAPPVHGGPLPDGRVCLGPLRAVRAAAHTGGGDRPRSARTGSTTCSPRSLTQWGSR